MFPPNGTTFRYASSRSRLEYRASSHSASADLAKLAGRRSRVQPIDQPRQLHRQRRSALAIAAAVRAERRAAERDGIHAGMPVEPAVLLEQERSTSAGDICGERHPQPVLIVGRAGHAQQLAVGRPHAGGQRHALRRAARCGQHAHADASASRQQPRVRLRHPDEPDARVGSWLHDLERAGQAQAGDACGCTSPRQTPAAPGTCPHCWPARDRRTSRRLFVASP